MKGGYFILEEINGPHTSMTHILELEGRFLSTFYFAVYKTRAFARASK